MNGFGLGQIGVLLGAGAVISLAVLWILGRFGAGRATSPEQAASPGLCFLFEGDELIDGEDVAPALADWAGLRHWLGGRFGALPKTLASVGPGKPYEFPAQRADDDATLTITARDAVRRVVLSDPHEAGPADRHIALTHTDRRDFLITALREAPCAISVIGRDGRVEWHNTACAPFVDDTGDGPHLCADFLGGDPDVPRRVAVTLPGDERDSHFEVLSTVKEDRQIHYAKDISPLVQAEAVRREFVLTLTKTFADLTTGLAVFDRTRQMALFNPALVDLTGLPAEFLSARPTLMNFFDRLRDKQVLPEPKNYAGWRSQINAMIETAADGFYRESWTQPNGLTLRVTGRPHPDGAVAFLFEDISDEISMTRGFRSELELRGDTLDALEDAVAVFAPNRVLIFCNDRFSELLGVDVDSCFAEMSAADLVRICRERLPDPAGWDRVEAVLQTAAMREPVTLSLGADDPVRGRIVPLPGGSAMLTLAIGAHAVADPEPSHA